MNDDACPPGNAPSLLLPSLLHVASWPKMATSNYINKKIISATAGSRNAAQHKRSIAIVSDCNSGRSIMMMMPAAAAAADAD